MRYYELFAQKFRVSAFSLKHTVESAQPLAFYAQYNEASNSLTYPTFTHVINVAYGGSAEAGELTAVSRIQNFGSDVARRFRLADNMKRIYKKIGTDAFMRAAIRKYYGMRLTLSDPWEAALCFVLSQNNNVKRIRRIVLNMIERFGQPIRDDTGNVVAKGFPTSASLFQASTDELKACGAGFRAKYVKSAAEFFASSPAAKELGGMSYPKLKEALMQIDGIGDKVADCIALMGYGRLEAFPIDTWAKRVLEKAYFHGRPQKIEKLHEYVQDRWGAYAGYAQQYLFWYGRQSKIRGI
ncbi:MAG: DNA-3-methyladenine glycosylase family protein [Candidatus Micrarchaeia archaeon]